MRPIPFPRCSAGQSSATSTDPADHSPPSPSPTSALQIAISATPQGPWTAAGCSWPHQGSDGGLLLEENRAGLVEADDLEANFIPGAELSDARQIGRDDTGDHRVSSGRLMIDPEQDRLLRLGD